MSDIALTETAADVIDGVRIYPFHNRFPGLPDLFHVSCPLHESAAFCGERHQAEQRRAEHIERRHRIAPVLGGGAS